MTILRVSATVQEMARLAAALAGLTLALAGGGCSLILDFGESLGPDGGHADAGADARPPHPDAGADQYEPNDNFDNATPIEAGTYEGLSIYPVGDVDTYKFTLGATHDVDIKALFTEVDGDLDMKLYDGTYQKVAVSLGFLDNEEISKTLAPGDYYIQIFGFENRFSNSYTLVLTII